MSFTMINPYASGFAAPQGSGANFLGFANRWQDAANTGRSYGQDLMSDVYNANQQQGKLNDQGTDQLLGRMKTATALYEQGNEQLAARADMFLNQCVLGGRTPEECRIMLDTAMGRAPQQQPTQTSTLDPYGSTPVPGTGASAIAALLGGNR